MNAMKTIHERDTADDDGGDDDGDDANDDCDFSFAMYNIVDTYARMHTIANRNRDVRWKPAEEQMPAGSPYSSTFAIVSSQVSAPSAVEVHPFELRTR